MLTVRAEPARNEDHEYTAGNGREAPSAAS